jgi:hypothetical protein
MFDCFPDEIMFKNAVPDLQSKSPGILFNPASKVRKCQNPGVAGGRLYHWVQTSSPNIVHAYDYW